MRATSWAGPRRGAAAGLPALAVLGVVLALVPGATAQPPDDAAPTPRAKPGTAAASSAPVSAAALEDRLAGLMRSAGSGSGAWVGVAERGGKTLFSARGGRRRILASNMKLFTTATALHRLGADGRLVTSVWAADSGAQPPGADDPGADDPGADEAPKRGRTLQGDLYLVGDGDPALGSASFAKRNGLPVTRLKRLAAAVRRAGVRRVSGRLRIDASVFDRRPGTGVSGWSTYIGPLAGLTYNSGRGARDPALAAGNAFREALRKRGVRVGEAARGRVPAEIRRDEPLASVRSPTLAELVEHTNVTSNNFFAEMLLKRLAVGGGRKGTTSGGARLVRRFAKSSGAGVRARDGSGLSRANRASPKQVGKLLVTMLDRPGGDAFHSSLPVAGREGTVRFRMRGTAAEGSCRAKTGTLTGVSALSGYCDAGGRELAFSILMNGVDVSAARLLQDRIVATIARYG